jgi:hypothetical protein
MADPGQPTPNLLIANATVGTRRLALQLELRPDGAFVYLINAESDPLSEWHGNLGSFALALLTAWKYFDLPPEGWTFSCPLAFADWLAHFGPERHKDLQRVVEELCRTWWSVGAPAEGEDALWPLYSSMLES